MPTTKIKKILIIEDEEILGDVLLKKLKNLGYDPRLARDGEAGFEEIKTFIPDLILLDIVMPKMNGYEVMEAMKKDSDLPPIPVIIISNSGQPVEIDRAKDLGAIDYLIKAQFTPEEVVEKVEAAFKNSSKKKNSEGNNGKKILIIEDDQFLRDLATTKLKREGFEVFGAVDGDEGLKMIPNSNPDIILLDIILPGIDGFEVLRRIKADKDHKNIPVILLSNLGQKSDIDRGLSLGASGYIIKAHHTLDEIIVKIKKCAQKKS